MRDCILDITMPFMRDCILDITMPFMRDCIMDIPMPFLDDIPIKGCQEDTKEETVGEDGCRRFIPDHIANYEKILDRLEGARITISREKSTFGQWEIVVVGYHIKISQYAHIAELLYGLLKKGRKLGWGEQQSEAVRRLKGMLTTAPALQKAIYRK